MREFGGYVDKLQDKVAACNGAIGQLLIEQMEDDDGNRELKVARSTTHGLTRLHPSRWTSTSRPFKANSGLPKEHVPGYYPKRFLRHANPLPFSTSSTRKKKAQARVADKEKHY